MFLHIVNDLLFIKIKTLKKEILLYINTAINRSPYVQSNCLSVYFLCLAVWPVFVKKTFIVECAMQREERRMATALRRVFLHLYQDTM